MWPSLELRTELTTADITHLANLCHDCRDCYTACMYTPPHEFAVNPPQLFAQVRARTYDEFVWPVWLAVLTRKREGKILLLLSAFVVLVALALITNGGSAFTGRGGSAYSVIGHWALVVVAAIPALAAIAAFIGSCARYWSSTHGPARDLLHLRPWLLTLGQAARLKHQAGGGSGCDYPDDSPSRVRRSFHHAVSYGFLMTFLSTVSAAASEYLFGAQPPFALLSVPVLTGTVGGAAMVVGCAGLLVLGRRADPVQSTPRMLKANRALIWSLLVLTLTGLLALVLRNTSAFGSVLLIHLAAVITAFCVAPFTKFAHFTYRVLAIYKANLEHAA